MSNLPTSSRPRIYTKKSRTTQYRHRIDAEKSAQENGQTLLDFFDYVSPTNINTIKRTSCDGEFFERMISDIDSIIRSDRNVSPGQRLRAEAVKHYLQLQQHGWNKIEASLLVAQLLNRGVWFARCIRSWGSAFIAFRKIPRSKRGLHFHINSILNDENVHSKMVSFLREHKFDVTAQQVCEYFSSNIVPSLGIEHQPNIR